MCVVSKSVLGTSTSSTIKYTNKDSESFDIAFLRKCNLTRNTYM